MHHLSKDVLLHLSGEREAPCLSLYQRTHRSHPENRQDPIRYRNLVDRLEESVLADYPARDVEPMLEPFRRLAKDSDFWNHRTDGLAVLGGRDEFHVFDLQRPVAELAIVAGSFHLKPLLRIVQSADRYQVLGLTRENVHFYEGNRDALDRVELQNVPRTLTEALGAELTEPHQTVASYGGWASSPHADSGEFAMRHGHGERSAEIEVDETRFFRIVDRAILEHYSRPSGLPLLLAALPEHQTPFREISHNPHLLAEGIRANPEALDTAEMRKQAWRVLEPQYLERLAKLVDAFETKRAQGQGSDNLAEVAKAAVAGRVATLLVDADRQVAGRLAPDTGDVEYGELAEADVDDLLDDVLEAVLRTKGEVVVVPAERMPTKSGLAATYRF